VASASPNGMVGLSGALKEVETFDGADVGITIGMPVVTSGRAPHRLMFSLSYASFIYKLLIKMLQQQ